MRLEKDREESTQRNDMEIIFYVGPNLKPFNILFMVELPLLAKHVDTHRRGAAVGAGGDPYFRVALRAEPPRTLWRSKKKIADFKKAYAVARPIWEAFERLNNGVATADDRAKLKLT